ncbi:MAG: pyridoxal phosphate-dependent aminotransferase [Candidatus Binatus sp.]|uniref:pyridoxal phosphate-dependent aminotransferase n=1 Tax=Candidatus Binatus sp. TaxID=2811406 RepID=UPI0027235996|nr:pyridoxal phosphate-dependent aminotransferase [Candidatus Binatus sp.]MDO8431676.1 pyridoxal phosphate-dependent aminotransferase [Candidatus Binatus sp.]
MLKLNRRIAAIKTSATMAADARATEMRLAGIDVVPLAAGEPDFDTPERIKDAARKAIAGGQTKYTPVGGTSALKKAIQQKLKRDNQLDYELNEIIASAGAKQSEANVIAALFDEGDEVIIPTPAWVSFAAMVSLSGAEPKFLPCSEESGFILEPDALRRAITPRTRGIMLNSPSNPTGAVYGAEQLSAIAKVLLDADIWVMSDDVYEHIVYEGTIPHLFDIEPQLKPRGIVFNSLSKTYAMTGWRIGFAAGPQEVIAAAGRLQSQNSGNPSSVTQAAAIEALTGPQDELAPMLEAFRARNALVVERVRRIPGFALPTVPQGAFYVFPNVSGLLGTSHNGAKITDGDSLAAYLLDQAHVSLVGGNDFGAPDHVRISYATSIENLNEGFDRIERAVAKLSS